MVRHALTLFAALLACAGCATRSTQRKAGRVRIAASDLRAGRTVQAKGAFDRDGFHAAVIDVEDADEDITIKAAVTDYRYGESLLAGGILVRIPDGARLRDADGERLRERPIPDGSWAKVQCRLESGVLVLRKLSLRVRADGDREEIRGAVRSIDPDRRVLAIGPVTVRWDGKTKVRWDASAPPPEGTRGVRTVERADTEDVRPGSVRVGEILTIGGEAQYEVELRDNFDLRDTRRRDRLLHELAIELEFSIDLADDLFGFVQVSGRQKFVGFDEDRDLEFEPESDLKEAYLRIENIFATGTALQVGRQDFDHGREWVMDRQLDAIRLHIDVGGADLQFSASTVLAGGTALEEDVVNFLIGAEIELAADADLFAYVLHRDGGSVAGFSLTHFGASLEAELSDWSIWADVGAVTGDDSGIDVAGFGLDIIVMRRFRIAGRKAYAYGGVAFGSGDPDIPSGIEGGFRQTGLHDNNDKLGGVTSFRYLGELVRPDVSNMLVLTLGVGLRPAKSVSIDVLFHHFEQDQAAPFFTDTRLRLDPNGVTTDIGWELDVVVGLERLFGSVDIEFIVGYFRPGDAFGSRDPALFISLQIEWNF